MESNTLVKIIKPGPFHNAKGTYIKDITVNYRAGLIKIEKSGKAPIYEVIPLDYLLSLENSNEKDNSR